MSVTSLLANEIDWHVEHGHALDVLRSLPEGSIQACVTSPPYWGLRNYGTEPQTWGSDAPDENHEWGEMERGKRKDILPADATTSTGRIGTTNVQRDAAINGGHFCTGGHDWQTVRPSGFRKNDDNPGPMQSPGTMNRTEFKSEACACGAWRGELGMEPTCRLYVQHMVEIFREVRRTLRDDGTLWVNIGDSFNGSGGAGGDYNAGGTLKPKDLVGVPWRLAFALQEDGWTLRSDIIWQKTRPMPESVTDRPTKSHEYVFLLTKSRHYFYNAAAVAEPAVAEPDGTRNRRSVWTIDNRSSGEKHYATMPVELASLCVRGGAAGTGGIVLDPFSGTGTTGLAAMGEGCRYLGIELQPEYHAVSQRRLSRPMVFREATPTARVVNTQEVLF